MDTQPELQQKYRLLFPHLNERQRRLIAAADAERIGRGGIALVARAAGLSRPTLYQAMRDLHADPLAPHRVRRPGAGRKRLTHQDPALVQALEALIDPATRGDPMSPLRWTCKSARQLARALTAAGHPVSHDSVAHLLGQLEYSLQGNAKTREGSQHPDRDAQFEYIYRQTKDHLAHGWPVISVDTKKKELVGAYANSGQEWQPMSCPEEVQAHDFPDPDVPKAVPDGIYDIGRDRGWVSVGCSHDTGQFAVESIRRWWRSMGAALYPHAGRLLICADSGGSNGYRLRLWKYELQRWADAVGLDVTVCHFPPGTSKWNKVEHRLFCHVTMNWRGRPLVSYRVVVNLIAATTTDTGLKVHAELDSHDYPTKLKVTKEQMRSVHLRPHDFHGEWNYTLEHQVASV
jgi:AcrR family transcriptional regulator